jgi:hypothetical protein
MNKVSSSGRGVAALTPSLTRSRGQIVIERSGALLAPFPAPLIWYFILPHEMSMLCFCAQAPHILYRPTLVCSTLSSLSPTCISYFIDAYEIPLDISLAYMKCRLFFEYFISLYEVSLRVFYAPARRYFIGPGEMSSLALPFAVPFSDTSRISHR